MEIHLEKGFWRNLGIILIIILFIWIIVEESNWRAEQITIQWENHRIILNNDLENIRNIGNQFENVKTSSELQFLINQLDSRLSLFEIHLIEARNFLNNNLNSFSNSMQLKTQIDNNLINIGTIRNEVNFLVDNYNQNVIEYNRKIQITEDLLKLMTIFV